VDVLEIIRRSISAAALPDEYGHVWQAPPTITRHRQPADAIRVIGKVGEIRRRSGTSGSGFDAVGIVVVDLHNDGTPMKLPDAPASPFPYSTRGGPDRARVRRRLLAALSS
jgi:hypothetical protein